MSARPCRTIYDLLGVAWLIGLALLFVLPALVHGSSLGPYDVLQTSGLTAVSGTHVHNAVGSDEILEFIPWETLDWLQVHAGHLPLWNPFNLLGMPLAFNFQSAPFSPTVAIGYLFPLHLAHTATVVARLILAGTGTYVCGRIIGLRPAAAIVGATIYELCGGFTIWLGAYEAGTLCLAGWVAAASIALTRKDRGPGRLIALSITLGLAFLSGEPQIDAVLVGFVACIAAAAATSKWRAGARSRARSILVDHSLALLAGIGLSAPVYLPGAQLLLGAARRSGPLASGLSPSDLTHVVFSSFNGVPTDLSTLIGPDNLYVSMLYVGGIGIALCAVGLSTIRSHHEAFGTAVFVGLASIFVFFPPAASLVRTIPYLRVFRLDLATTMIDFGIALLGAFGAAALLGDRGSTRVEGRPNRLLARGTATLAMLLAIAFVLSRTEHLSHAQWSARAESFIAPAVSVAALTVACVAFAQPSWSMRRRSNRHGVDASWTRAATVARNRRLIVALLVVTEAAVLLQAGAGMLSSSKRFFPKDSSVATLQRLIGHRLVGFSTCHPGRLPSQGIAVDANAAYGVSELAVYDPIIPASYYRAAGLQLGANAGPALNFLFCPAIRSVATARRYGVSFLLLPSDQAPPAGTARITSLGGESLVRVPNSGRATLTPIASTSTRRPDVVSLSQSPPGTASVSFDASKTSRLFVRLTPVPGWHGEIDGKPLLLRAQGLGFEAVVPPGRHRVTLTYWPTAFSIGLLLALASALALLCSAAAATRRLVVARTLDRAQRRAPRSGSTGDALRSE